MTRLAKTWQWLLVVMATLGVVSGIWAPGDAGPALRDVIRVSVRTTVVGLDSKYETSSTVGAINSNVLESLVTIDYDGATIRPQLATEWKAESPTSWVFKLRPNVKFHDGTPFNAAAVKFGLERMADQDSSQRGDFSWLQSVQVVDDLTVRIRAKFPYAPMLSSLASPLYFKSWGMVPTAAKGKMTFPCPSVVRPSSTTWDLILVPWPILTCGPMIE